MNLIMAGTGGRSVLVEKAIERMKELGEWDGKTFDEELSKVLRELFQHKEQSNAG